MQTGLRKEKLRGEEKRGERKRAQEEESMVMKKSICYEGTCPQREEVRACAIQKAFYRQAEASEVEREPWHRMRQ